MKYLATILLTCCCLFETQAQSQDIVFRHITSAQGLSQNHVYAILRDHEGFMWFGTQDGLNKYDGYKITVYKNDANDPGSLGNDFINVIFEDREGNLWIGTHDGLDLFDRDNNKFIHYRSDESNPKALSFKEVLSI